MGQALRGILCGLGRRVASDRTGSLAVMAGIFAPILVTGLALSVDASYWRYRQTVLQSSADTSAISVVYEITSIANHANGGVIVDNNTTFPITYTVGKASKTFMNIGAYSNFLSATAQFDSKRNCTETGGFACSAAMTWPVGSDYTSAYVVTVDNTARRFFSPLITTSTKTMGSHAVATTSGTTTGGTSGGSADDGCVMSLAGIATLINTSFISSPCTVIANGGNVDVEQNSYVAGTGYATGTVTQGNIQTNDSHSGVAYGGQQKSNMPAVADPYLSTSYYPSSLRSGSSAGSNYFPSGIANGSSVPCNDVINGGTMQTNTVAQQNSANQDWNAANNSTSYTGGYNLDQAGDVNKYYPFKGFTLQPNGSYSITGGGRFCMGFNWQSVTVNFGPGIYIMEQAVNFNGTTINGDGATLVFNAVQGSVVDNTTFNLRAPVSGTAAPIFGPTGTADLSRGIAGLVLTTGPGQTGTIAIDGNNTINIEGDIYFPTNAWTSQTGLVLSASIFSGTPGSGVTASTITASGTSGCGRVVALSFTDSAAGSATLGNACQVSYGVQPFGTAYGASGAGGWTGTATPATTKTKTTASTYPRITQ